ncbi:hypothetical protein NDU88_004412 [Pleurodeles waltl]|uniref:Uncharacterized protein n=1 Tax=Pleurodeles waltl TaxID=8319 RepID=A0AAV7UF62_PLEWA|nr:hypothetical protein NDU88_004412 [Pleurodeles waltl]
MTLVMIAKYLPGGLFVHASCFKGAFLSSLFFLFPLHKTATRSGRGPHHKGPPLRAGPRSIPSRPPREQGPGAGAPAQPRLLRHQSPLSGSRGVPRSRGECGSSLRPSPRNKGRLCVPAAQVGRPHFPRPGSASLRDAARAEPGATSDESGHPRSRAPEQGHQHSLTCSGVSVPFPAAGSFHKRVGNAAPASVPAPAAKGSTTSRQRRQAGLALHSPGRPLLGSQTVP